MTTNSPKDTQPSVRYKVEGMDCPSCALKIETALKRVKGAGEPIVNVGAGTVAIPTSDGFNQDDAANAIRKLGFSVKLEIGQSKDNHDDHNHDDPDDHGKAWWQTSKGRLVMISGGLLVISFGVSQAFPNLGMWPFALAALIALYPVARRAIAAARSGSIFTIEMLMTIAAIGALFIDAAEEAAVVVFLFAVGELLEGVAASRARKSITALGDLTPKTAQLVDGGSIREVPADSLSIGQIVIVRAGDRVPCDGKIIEGRSEIDEAPVTGESTPRSKDIGDNVFAGTINIASAIKIEVTNAAADNTIARIIKLVEEAQESKAPVQRFVDKFARIYMPIVVVIALFVAIIPPIFLGGVWDVWVYRSLSLLLIACPCALVISTPAAIAAGMATGARRGLLIKGGAVLENLGSLKMIAFDKTGTLTEGRPQVTDVKGFDIADNDILRFAAALEGNSNHPIARAVLSHSKALNIEPPLAEDVKIIAGRGLSGKTEGREFLLVSPRAAVTDGALPKDIQMLTDALESEGKTVTILLENNTALGLFAVRDEARQDALDGLDALKRLGITPIMLTGDNQRTAKAIGKTLGIEVYAELMPEDKAKIVRDLDETGRGPIGKVGDGINDAPALAAASVGIAMGGGTDVALETADAALLNNSVMGVAELVDLSRATLANIRLNVTLALGSKVVFLVTTVLGMTGMWIAVMADTGATVLVTLNALRLLRYQFKPK